MRISDWSSDVCSSDLPQRRDAELVPFDHHVADQRERPRRVGAAVEPRAVMDDPGIAPAPRAKISHEAENRRSHGRGQIGRTSCRERVCQYVLISGVGVSLKKKKT